MTYHIESMKSILDNNLEPFDIHHSSSYEELAKQIGDAKIVMLGEATHGTYEFYYIRQQLSKYLIEEHGFNAIAVEGDFTSCYTTNLYLHGKWHANDTLNALTEFKRFPTWMWRNEVTLPFIRNLRDYNDFGLKVQFYGLDLYSLHSAILEVVRYLQEHDPEAANEAIKRYSCFENTTHHPEEYGALVKYAHKKACIEAVTRQLISLQQTSLHDHDWEKADKLFYATQNARLVKNAELYYRAMFEPHVNTWNIRDNHMFETLQNIEAHLSNTLELEPKIIIWAHNSHVGNALATDMTLRGELNIGQLVKEHYKDKSFALGFSTYTGSVLAADDWGDTPKCKRVNPGLGDSYEELFHNTHCENFILYLKNNPELQDAFAADRLQRAIGVIYRPQTERWSHYYNAKLYPQFDALIHLDVTRAIEELA